MFEHPRARRWEGEWILPDDEHDEWSKMGEEHLGEVNVRWECVSTVDG